MAGQPTQPAKVILTFIAPCYHNFVFIIETAEMAHYFIWYFWKKPSKWVLLWLCIRGFGEIPQLKPPLGGSKGGRGEGGGGGSVTGEVFFDISEKKSLWMSVIMYERHRGGSTTKTSPEGGQGGGGRGEVFFIRFPWNLECICRIEF